MSKDKENVDIYTLDSKFGELITVSNGYYKIKFNIGKVGMPFYYFIDIMFYPKFEYSEIDL